MSETYTYNTKNRQLSQHLFMSLDTRITDLNNNVLVIGGAGAGKTYRFVKPQVLTLSSSFIFTDPKGELLRDCGGFLKDCGYEVKVLNLLNADGMKHSNHYNPFRYIQTGIDIEKLITNMIQNTTPKNSMQSDPFWEKAETMLWQALFYYVWEHEPMEQKNIPRVLELLAMAEFEEDARGNKKKSRLDEMFDSLQEREQKRMEKERGEGKIPNPMDPAVAAYNGCMRGAADTVRSIIISANARLNPLKSPEVLELLRDDEMDIAEIGAGRNYDKKTKTALFCVIPDNDKTFNFIVGMLYSQIFQELYYQADFNYGGKLPIHVTFMMDEFANVALPDGFTSLLSTMRSREISSVIIIQNMAQIKELFEKSWETITGNCDSLIYLGGNEQETHKYISEALGKATIEKRSNGQTLGRQGSSSRNFDETGRELMLPDEVRRTDGKKCIVLIKGYPPILEDKIETYKHPLFYKMDGKYVHMPQREREMKKARMFIHEEYLKHVKEEEERTGKETCFTMTMDDLLKIPNEKVEEWDLTGAVEDEIKGFMTEKEQERRIQELKERCRKEKEGINNLSPREVLEYAKLKRNGYLDAAVKELLPFLKDGMNYDAVKELFGPEASVEEIKSIKSIYYAGRKEGMDE